MRFSRFRLTGFKSFVEPTEVSIDAGLTGIVGPNGCGKSNLVEALQWVMGENSYKAMRGSEMEDVIFSGSTARPARNAAEVGLTLDNGERSAPLAYNDEDTIDVSRRIEREAGSSYRINGREVRARDVQLLFADSSIGAHSAAIVGQGRVGSLISAKPEARRGILEEAAGVHGLFGRRHEAELRLRAAEQNLDRLEDVLAEIERQLEGLRRQARQAVRYRKLSGEIRKAEAVALVIRHRSATEAAAAARTALQESSTALTDAGAVHSRASADQAAASELMPALRDEAAAAAAGVQRIRIEGERLDQEERSVKEQIGELERRLTQLRADGERERALLADAAATLERLAAEKEKLAAESADHEPTRIDIVEQLAVAESALGQSEKLMADANGALADLKARRNQAEKDLGLVTEREARLGSERTNIIEARGSLSPSGSDDRLQRGSEALAEAEKRLSAAERASLSAEADAIAARDNATGMQTSMSEADAALVRMETEAKALRSILPVNAVQSPLIENVTTKGGAEAALAALLSEDLELSIDPGDPAHWRQIDGNSDPDLPAGAEQLAMYVDGPVVLRRRLEQTGLVDAADGAALQAALRPGQSLVSRDGDLWRWDGLVANAASRRSAAERLKARQRLGELALKIEEFRPVVAQAGETRQAARLAAEGAGREEASCREAWRAAQKGVDKAREELAAAEREQSRVASRLAALAEAESRIAASIGEAHADREAAAEALEQMALPVALESPILALQEKMVADRNAVAELRALLAGLDRDRQIRDGRLAAIDREQADWASRTSAAKLQIEALMSRTDQVAGLREEMEGRPTAIAERRQAILGRSVELEQARTAATDTLAEAEAVLAAADKAAANANEELSFAREQRGRLEERVASATERLVEISDRIQETLQCNPEQAAELAGIAGDESPALDQIETRLERFKQERERLGGVNLQADREAEELSERRNMMTTDRDDLIAAIGKLRQGIGNLNREGRERLVAAFETVNTQFERLFVQLFGGGTAELKLVGSDDPLEAGLEIIAKPPGKKPQTMTLLSGGEQALTALSLIFAVFLTNPAPICVLDEVDAPLDDANVERFCDLLEEITRDTGTRFLVITHNPITMARMNRLFGVTMTERGVSQLVSVDLEAAEQFREAG